MAKLCRNSKSNVLSDMLSDSIKYKDLRSEKHTYKSAIGSKRIKKSLYYIPADCKSAGTLVLLVYIVACKPRCLETTRLMFCRICYPAVSNIRICNPRLIPINQKIGSKRIKKSLYYIPADYKSAGTLVLLVHIRRHIFLNYNAFDSNYSNFYNYFNY